MYYCTVQLEAEFLDEIQTKVFLLVIHSYKYIFALRIIFLQTHATSYRFYSSDMYTVKEKGRKPYPLSYGLNNPYRNLKYENSQDYAQKPQRNCTFINLASESTTPLVAELSVHYIQFINKNPLFVVLRILLTCIQILC
jgi:hypothetical protein